MRRPLRIILLALASGAAALGAAFVAGDRVAPAAQRGSGPAHLAARAADASPAWTGAAGRGLPARPALGEPGTDPFSPPEKDVPRVAVMRDAPPPGAPPLPYRFAGRVYLESGTQVYVARDTKVIAVKKGDVVDGTYRV